MSEALGTIRVKVTICMPDRSTARHIGRYYSVKEAFDIASAAFPEAFGISCINLGARA